MVATTPGIYTSEPIGSLTSKDGRTFTIQIGLDKKMAEQVRWYSSDPSDTDLLKNTSDLKRFGEGSYEKWYAKERTPYALVAPDGTLAALVWLGPKPLGRKSLRYLSERELAEEGRQEKTQWHTLVYRSYRPFRGTGLMRTFVQEAIANYKKRYPQVKLWVGISTDNEASLALAKKLGFKVVPQYIDEEAHWCALIEE